MENEEEICLNGGKEEEEGKAYEREAIEEESQRRLENFQDIERPRKIWFLEPEDLEEEESFVYKSQRIATDS